VGSSLRGNGQTELSTDGFVHHDLCVGLHPTQRAFQVQDGFLDSSNFSSHRTLSLLLNPEELKPRSKTGEFDDSILLDSRFLKPWASTLYKELHKQPPQQLLWDFSYQSYYEVFMAAVKTLQLDVTPYNMRHSGPSIDRSQNLRPLLEVQKRGRWKSHKSVARYEKSARLAANFNQIPLHIQRHCLHAESLLGDVMLGRIKPPVPR